MRRAPPTPPAPDAALAALRALAGPAHHAGLPRYGIPNAQAIGVRMADIQALAKSFGRHQPLAEALWESELYEARLLAAFVAQPGALPPATLERWLLDLDSWAICDTLCFHLLDRAPEGMTKPAAGK